jgi:hypothetical protein
VALNAEAAFRGGLFVGGKRGGYKFEFIANLTTAKALGPENPGVPPARR